MKYFAYTVLATALLAPAPLLAQDTSPSRGSAAASSQGDQRTITGCIAAGIDSRSFTFTQSATSATSPDRDSSSARAATPAAQTSWTLMSSSEVDLSKYVGKKVELTGSPDNKGGMSDDRSSSTSRSPNATTGPRFHVKSVRVLADTCS